MVSVARVHELVFCILLLSGVGLTVSGWSPSYVPVRLCQYSSSPSSPLAVHNYRGLWDSLGSLMQVVTERIPVPDALSILCTPAQTYFGQPLEKNW